ncbi:MAG TPA: hypothetical protein VFO23_08130 [Steroidobacteraceae bacterium]|nr:hypothetical protein [Steroidobacteraceae bacterium]
MERPAEPREYHTEPVPREAPLAHFEPAPKPDTGAAPSKPYVVWSSTPSPGDGDGGAAGGGGGRGSEE